MDFESNSDSFNKKKNPYEILNIKKESTREEIDNAYKTLLEKYNPTLFVASPLEKIALDKVVEINWAYKQLVPLNTNIQNMPTASYNQEASPLNHLASFEFSHVKEKLDQKDFDEARSLLNAVVVSKRNAEWNFLFATLLNETGYSQNAFTFFEKAFNAEPANPIYSSAYNTLLNKRKGEVQSNPFPDVNMPKNIGCGCNNLCCGLLTLDCCCELMGGDCIACC